jgi:multidrug efflux pump
VEFGNQRKEAGLSTREAILESATARFRPIVMTSLTAILGSVPIALALGAGAKSRVSMGIVVIGGLLFSLALTLFVVPALYTYLATESREGLRAPAAGGATGAERGPEPGGISPAPA